MVLAKTNKGISSYYESLLVPDELQVRRCFVLQASPHSRTSLGNRYSRKDTRSSASEDQVLGGPALKNKGPYASYPECSRANSCPWHQGIAGKIWTDLADTEAGILKVSLLTPAPCTLNPELCTLNPDP